MRDYTHKNVYIGIDVHKKTYAGSVSILMLVHMTAQEPAILKSGLNYPAIIFNKFNTAKQGYRIVQEI